MQENISSAWSHGFKFINFMKIRALYSRIKRTPYEATFDCVHKVWFPQLLLEEKLEDEQQFENSLTRLNCIFITGWWCRWCCQRNIYESNCKKVSFERYDNAVSVKDAAPNETVKVCVVCSKTAKTAYFALHMSSLYVPCLAVCYTEDTTNCAECLQVVSK